VDKKKVDKKKKKNKKKSSSRERNVVTSSRERNVVTSSRERNVVTKKPVEDGNQWIVEDLATLVTSLGSGAVETLSEEQYSSATLSLKTIEEELSRRRVARKSFHLEIIEKDELRVLINDHCRYVFV
jgi:hypothetical protein